MRKTIWFLAPESEAKNFKKLQIGNCLINRDSRK